jgi:hypothetical protein
MSRQDQLDHHPQHPRVQQVLDQGDRQEVKTDDIYEDDGDWSEEGNWSDRSSELNTPSQHHVTATRRHTRPRQAPKLGQHQHEPHAIDTTNAKTNRPAQFNYNAGAGGQAVPYGNPFMPESNPFSPNPLPNPQNANRHPLQNQPSPYQPPPPTYPARPYAADSYGRNDSWYPGNYFQGNPNAHPTNSGPINTYPYPIDSSFGNTHPYLPQYAPYAVRPAVHTTPLMASPSPLEQHLDDVQRELEELKLEQHEAKKKRERLRAKSRHIEEAARGKKDIEKIKKDIEKISKQFERKAKTEVSQDLRPERAFRESDTRSDPGRTHLPYDIGLYPEVARRMQDAFVYLNDRSQPDRVLEEIAGLIEGQRRQSERSSYGGSVKSSLDGASRKRVVPVPGAFYDARSDQTLREQLQEIVRDILQDLRLERKEDDCQPLPSLAKGAASDVYSTCECHQRPRARQPDLSRYKISTRAVDARAVDSGYSSSKIATSGGARDRVSDPRFNEAKGQPRSSQETEENERIRERTNSQSKHKGRRVPNQQAYQGIVSSSDSEGLGLDPRRPPRIPAPYALPQGHPNLRGHLLPTAPDAPFSR